MAGALQTMIGLLRTSSVPYSVSAGDIFASAPAGTSVSGTSASTVFGGTGPFTYSWVKTSGLAGVVLTNTTTATVTATKTSTAIGTQIGTITLTVTDTGAGGATTARVISAELENF